MVVECYYMDKTIMIISLIGIIQLGFLFTIFVLLKRLGKGKCVGCGRIDDKLFLSDFTKKDNGERLCPVCDRKEELKQFMEIGVLPRQFETLNTKGGDKNGRRI